MFGRERFMNEQATTIKHKQTHQQANKKPDMEMNSTRMQIIAHAPLHYSGNVCCFTFSC